MFEYLLSLQGKVPLTTIANAWWYWTKLKTTLPTLEEPNCDYEDKNYNIMFSWYGEYWYVECEIFKNGLAEWFWRYEHEPNTYAGEDTNIEQQIPQVVLDKLKDFVILL